MKNFKLKFVLKELWVFTKCSFFGSISIGLFLIIIDALTDISLNIYAIIPLVGVIFGASIELLRIMFYNYIPVNNKNQ